MILSNSMLGWLLWYISGSLEEAMVTMLLPVLMSTPCHWPHQVLWPAPVHAVGAREDCRHRRWQLACQWAFEMAARLPGTVAEVNAQDACFKGMTPTLSSRIYSTGFSYTPKRSQRITRYLVWILYTKSFAIPRRIVFLRSCKGGCQDTYAHSTPGFIRFTWQKSFRLFLRPL